MKKILMNNLGLKIVSIIIAVLVWLAIDNVNDPIVTKTYPVPVTVQNSAYIESIGKTYQVEDDRQVVTVILRGRRSQVEGRVNDIQAVADLTQIVNMDTKPYVMVPVSVTCDRVPIENISVVPGNMEVKIENAESQEFVVTVNTGDSTPAAGYEVGTTEVKPEKVEITGPESLMKIIDRVTANINVSKLAEDTTTTSRLKIYDKNQNELTDVQMSYLKFGGLENPIVDVDIKLWEVIKNIELDVDYTGVPSDGFEVTGVDATPTSISVAGTKEALAELSKTNKIEIPAEAIDVSNRADDFEVKLDIGSFLPKDTKLLSSDAQSAIVHVSVLPIGSKQFSISTTNIKTTGLDDSLNLVFDKDKVTVRVRGDAGTLTTVNENTVRPVIDLKGKEQGSHSIPLELALPEGCDLLGDISVQVSLIELE